MNMGQVIETIMTIKNKYIAKGMPYMWDRHVKAGERRGIT
jgi:hypothetical protein